MEAFEIHMEVITKSGWRFKHVSKNFAMTGFEAAHKTKSYIYNKVSNVESVKLCYWKVLNPFKAHFQK